MFNSPGRMALLLALTLPACADEAKKQLYFRDLVPPVGVGRVVIVSDVSLNTGSGGEITIKTAVEPAIDKDDLDRLMNAFFRQVKDRRGFQKTDRPAKVDLRIFSSEEKAKTGGEGWLGQVVWSGSGEPTMTNKQKPPLLKWAQKALGKQPEFSGALKPQLLADPETLALELTIPFVTDDGSGKYVESLSYVKAITEFVSYTLTLFEKVPPLRKLTFVGRHHDGVVMKIWLTRDQFIALDLKQVEEGLGAFQGQFIEPIMSKQISEKVVEAKVVKQRRKVYRETLAKLPKEQVELAKSLQ